MVVLKARTIWEPVVLEFRCAVQLDEMDEMRDVVVALSATMWSVVLSEFDEKAVVVRTPPGRELLFASPYCGIGVRHGGILSKKKQRTSVSCRYRAPPAVAAPPGHRPEEEWKPEA